MTDVGSILFPAPRFDAMRLEYIHRGTETMKTKDD